MCVKDLNFAFKREAVKCKYWFKGEFNEYIHVQVIRRAEMSLQLNAKLASFMDGCQLHLHWEMYI